MGFKVVKWRSSKKLPCACNGTANVILRVNSALIAPHTCIESDGETDFTFTTIEAQIVGWGPIRGGCNQALYEYTFSYDDTQLVSGANLAYTDISGVICTGTLTDYIADKAGQGVYVEGGELVNQFGCHYPLTSTYQDSVDSVLVVDLIDFAGREDQYFEDVDISITNPSSEQPLRVLISAGWMLQAYSTAFFQAGLGVEFRIDDELTDIYGIDGGAAGEAINLYFTAGTATLPIVVPAGATVVFTFRIGCFVATEPDETFRAKNIVISLFGAV
jgi:hypothetical protein